VVDGVENPKKQIEKITRRRVAWPGLAGSILVQKNRAEVRRNDYSYNKEEKTSLG
jgi:hypothetical protein